MSSDFGHGEDYSIKLAEIGEKSGKLGGIAAIFILSPGEVKSPKTGSIVNIQVKIPVGPKLLLPRRALTNNKGEIGLFLVKPDNRVEFTPVKYLDFDDDHITIIGNELNNKNIAVEGNYLLKTGDLVKVIR